MVGYADNEVPTFTYDLDVTIPDFEGWEFDLSQLPPGQSLEEILADPIEMSFCPPLNSDQPRPALMHAVYGPYLDNNNPQTIEELVRQRMHEDGTWTQDCHIQLEYRGHILGGASDIRLIMRQVDEELD